jgi:hypothetical protein
MVFDDAIAASVQVDTFARNVLLRPQRQQGTGLGTGSLLHVCQAPPRIMRGV